MKQKICDFLKSNPQVKGALSVLSLLLLTAILAGCSILNSQNTDKPSSDSESPKRETTEILSANAQMALSTFDEKLIQYIDEQYANQNYTLSPLSFRYALGLLLPGANGETKTELMNALGITDEAEWENVCKIFNGFAEKYSQGVTKEKEEFEQNKKNGYVGPDAVLVERGLSVANSVWKRDTIAKLKTTYVNKIERLYSSEYYEFTEADLVKNVNEWVNKKTKAMIPKLLSEQYDTSNTRLVLMNALYFKDSWVYPFSKYCTEEKDFTTCDHQTVKKEFMTRTEDFLYYADDNTKLIILPMNDEVYATFVIGDTSDLASKTAHAKYCKVKVSIPKLDLETSFSNGELCDFLKQNGANLMFSSEADFTAMTDHPVFVSDIIQKTRLKLDEDGIEAAAVTAILMEKTAMEPIEDPVEFTADEPFSFYIYTTANDITEMMFAGHVVK